MEEKVDEMLRFNYHNVGANTWSSEEIMRWMPSSSSSSSAAAAANLNFLSFQPNSETDVYRSNDVVNVDDENIVDENINHVINFSSLDEYSNHKQKSKSPLEAHNHVMAERKRRQNLRQLFISLSKAVPGLRKLDKASILEDAIDYLKGLKERVGVLEEAEEILLKENKEKKKINSSKYKEKDRDSSDEMGEIEAKISGKQVLVKIFCQREMKMVMWKIPIEMGKIHLNVVDLSVMPFGEAALHITILAQMQGEFRGNAKDIVDLLHTLLPNARCVIHHKPL